jgi:DNA replication licensing factor MCM3
MIKNELPRLIIRIDDLRTFDAELARNFQRNPSEYLPAFESALEDRITRLEPDYFEDNMDHEAHIGLEGNMGLTYHVTPRQLLSNFLGRLVCVEGIITKCSVVLPKVVRTVHYCPATNKFLTRSYRDMTTIGGIPTGATYPTRDAHNNPLDTEYGHCRYKDTQTLYMQEMPERAPAGQLPRSVECILEDDLVDRVKPGDRVRLYGIYRAVASRGMGSTMSGTMRTVLIVNQVIPITSQINNASITEKEKSHIQYISTARQGGELLSYLAKSIAPTIFGHENIKKALLLLLLGGVEKNFETSNTHIRGDLNILMVGDPSTAKSQLLRFMMHVAPLAISTTGRASTGVGLTAAIVADKDTGERGLQAGAMVLADRGVVCVDEFDKMSDIDRVAMHEVMEQQTVTIAKAGVHTCLNARCSVVAAANPIYGQYNREASIQRNVGLPDSLLSRFDLVFILLDERDPIKDNKVAHHVLKVHSETSRADEMNVGDMLTHEMSMTPINYDADGDDDDEEFLRNPDAAISIKLLRKYIAYAKHNFFPKLSEEAREVVIDKYTELRRNNNQKTLPITPRTLETLIRLSTAMAKMHLREQVLKEDVEDVYKLMQFAICFMNHTNNKEMLAEAEKQSEEASKPQNQNGETNGTSSRKLRSRKKSRESRTDKPKNTTIGTKRKHDNELQEQQEKIQEEDVDDIITDENDQDHHVTEQHTKIIYDTVRSMMESGRTGEVKKADLVNKVRGKVNRVQLDSILKKMEEEDLVLIQDDVLYSVN